MKLTIKHGDGEKLTIKLDDEKGIHEIIDEAILPALNWYFGWDVTEKLRDLLDEVVTMRTESSRIEGPQ